MKTLLAILAFPVAFLSIATMDSKNFKTNSDPSIKLTISTDQTTFKLPSEESADDWFELNIHCVITNTTDSSLTVVSPNAFRIYPHPWMIEMNGRSARQWSGDIMCAPNFTEKDKLTIKPNQDISVTFQWHTFIKNFEQTPGVKRFRLKYHLLEGDEVSRHVNDIQKDLKEIESDWSNEISLTFEY